MSDKNGLIDNEIILPEKRNYEEELLLLIRSDLTSKQLKDALSDYHDNDIAEIIPKLSKIERKKLYRVLGIDGTSSVFTYLDDAEQYLGELEIEKVADIIESMDADDAVEILDELEEDTKNQIIKLIDDEVLEDIELINSYDDNLIGSKMTTNFVTVNKDATVKKAMSTVIKQAADNDNISTIYVLDGEVFYGAIELRDLVVARDTTPFESIISTNYPFVYANETISDCIEKLKDYQEDSIPVLNKNNELIGVITSSDVTQVAVEEISDDYAKLAGLTSEEDLDEPIFKSVKKRIPWLLVLLVVGFGISYVTQAFQSVIPLSLIILYSFQTLILSMSGNTSTQSLGVTIRVVSDEQLTTKQKLLFILKELRVSVLNGIIVGLISFLFVGLYLTFVIPNDIAHLNVSPFAISGCIGISLFIAMIIAGLIGTLIPMFFKKVGIDPAIASGPLITTLNDFISVCCYYGISFLMLVNLLGIA